MRNNDERLNAIRDEMISQLETVMSAMPSGSGSRVVQSDEKGTKKISREWDLLNLAKTWAILSGYREEQADQPRESAADE